MNNRTGGNIFTGVAAAVLSIFTSQGAIGQDVAGQDAASTRAAGELEEIVVTAQRREASLQDLALSVRALTGEELQRMGAVRIEDYASFVPGLNLVEQELGGLQIEMRGVTIGPINFDTPQMNPTVGVYLDEAPIASQHFNADIALMDLERIEVMRGPQATLYGANSLSGTIRVITRKPELAEFGGRLGAGGSYTEHGGGNFDFNGMVNVPIIKDELALRAVGLYRDEDGYIDNPVRGKENVNDRRDVGGKLALRYEPTDYFRLDASFGYQDRHAGMVLGYYEEAGDLNALHATPNPEDSEQIIASLVAELDFDVATLTSATSYFGHNSKTDTEISRFTRFLTGIPLDAPPSADDFLAVDTAFTDRDEFTQELRLVSKDEGRLTWIAGLLFQQQNWGYGEDLPSPGIDAFTGIDSTDFLVEPDNLFKNRTDIEITQLSLFGEASVTLFDRLTAKAGLRWFYAAQDSTTFYGGIFAAPVGTGSADHSENGVNPTVNVSYQIDDDRMIYVQAARGFRLGGTNLPLPEDLCEPFLAAAGFSAPPRTFDSDHLWNYEAGLKSSWLNDRLRINASGYLIDWQSPPYEAEPCPGFGQFINLGKADISGFELDVEAGLAERLISRLGVSYIDSELGEDVPLAHFVKGDKAPYTPEWTLSFSLDYDFPVVFLDRGLMAFVHGDVRWIDERLTRFPSDVLSAAGVFNLSPYSEGNLRAGLYSEGAWRLEVFIRNLWDERPELAKATGLSSFTLFTGTEIHTSRPRTFGVQVSREF